MTNPKRSPIAEEVQLFTGFNPPMVASCLRDTLRYLFSITDVQGLKYSLENPKDRDIAVDIVYEANQEGPIQKVPKVIINRGGYTNIPVGITDSVVGANLNPLSSQRESSDYLNLVNGEIEITVKAWNLGTCEVLAYYVNVFLTWSRPHLCNTLGFKNLGNPISVSAPMADKDDKECFIIQLRVPYVTEMRWYEKQVGIKIREFLTQITS